MWLVTTFGYFSIVQKNSDRGAGTLTIRARVRKDLERLREKYLPNMGPIESSGGADYPYRTKAKREDLARAFATAVMDVTYSNFKSEVAFHMGFRREDLYNGVWLALRKLQSLDEAGESSINNVPSMLDADPAEDQASQDDHPLRQAQ